MTFTNIAEALAAILSGTEVYTNCSVEGEQYRGRFPRVFGENPELVYVISTIYLSSGASRITLKMPPCPGSEVIPQLEATGKVVFNDTPRS